VGPVSAKVEIDASRQRAFEFVGDLANRPAFTDHFLGDFHLLDVESSGVGAGARFRAAVPPKAIWMDTTITRAEGPHRLSERGRGGKSNRTPVATEWEFLEGPGPLTTVKVAFWTQTTHVTDRVIEVLGASSFWWSRDWATALGRLRPLLESGQIPATRVRVAGGNRLVTGVP
jgi:hypothetical protein